MALLITLVVSAANTSAQTTGFTYQGRLTDAGAPVTGSYDLTFALFPIVSGGTHIGADVVHDDVQVTTGVFTVNLDFGSSPFTSDTARYLEIAVRPGASTGAYTTLVPRQPITSSPYSVSTIRAVSAASADVATNALQLGGVTAGQFVQTADARLSDDRAPTAGSAHYIHNTTSTQASSNFNVSGTGTANMFNATTQYNIGGTRVMSAPGFNNTFAGRSAGNMNVGAANANSFFGWSAGVSNNTGANNSYFGTSAGFYNTNGSDNSYFGAFAGVNARLGGRNSFFGTQAGGADNNVGSDNSFVGWFAGQANTIGGMNTFVGASSGASITVENNNTVVGSAADGAAGVVNATAIGHRSKVTQSNSLVLGSINTVNNATADTNVGIGTTAPARRLHVSGTGSDGAGHADLRITGTGPIASGITLESTGSGGRTYSWLSTADNTGGGGSGPGRLAAFDVTAGAYRMVIDADGNVGIGTFSPDRTLTVNGTADKPGGGSWDVFSDERLKTIKGRFTHGLKALMQLQPVRYEYKSDNALGLRSSGEHIGFGAQAVQKIIPEAVTTNARGYLLVNNDPILWTMLNAIKEQQLQLDQKDAEIQTLKADDTALIARFSKIERMVQECRSAPARR